MGKYVEDARVVTFAADTLVAHDTYLNEQQDQIRGVFKALDQDVTSLFVPDTVGTWVGEDACGGANDPGWTTAAACNGDLMQLHLPLRVGAKLTQIDITYKGSNRAGGEIALYRDQLMAVGNAASPDAGAATKLYDLGENAANPWQPTVNPLNWHRVQTAMAVTIAAGYRYWIRVGASTTGAGAAEKFFHCYLTYQLGN
jgi:hypothetical protein